jgi:hypothetical protein
MNALPEGDLPKIIQIMRRMIGYMNRTAISEIQGTVYHNMFKLR